MSTGQPPQATTVDFLTDQLSSTVEPTNQSERLRTSGRSISSKPKGNSSEHAQPNYDPSGSPTRRGSISLDNRNPQSSTFLTELARSQGLHFVDIPLHPATPGFLHHQSGRRWMLASAQWKSGSTGVGEFRMKPREGFSLQPQVRDILSQHIFIGDPQEDVGKIRPTMARIPEGEEQYLPASKRHRNDLCEMIGEPVGTRSHTSNPSSAVSIARLGLRGQNPDELRGPGSAAGNLRYSPQHPMYYDHAPGATRSENLASRQLVNTPSAHGGARGNSPYRQHATHTNPNADPNYGDLARMQGSDDRHGEDAGRCGEFWDPPLGSQGQQGRPLIHQPYSQDDSNWEVVHGNREMEYRVSPIRPGDFRPGPDLGHPRQDEHVQPRPSVDLSGRFGPPQGDYQTGRDPWTADSGRPDPRRHSNTYGVQDAPLPQTGFGRVAAGGLYGEGREVPFSRSYSMGHVEPSGGAGPMRARATRTHSYGYPSPRHSSTDRIPAIYSAGLQHPNSTSSHRYQDEPSRHSGDLSQSPNWAVRRHLSDGPNRGPRGDLQGDRLVVDGSGQGYGPGPERPSSAGSLLHPCTGHPMTRHPSSEQPWSPYFGPERLLHERISPLHLSANPGPWGNISLPARRRTLSSHHESAHDAYVDGRRSQSTSNVAVDPERRRSGDEEDFGRRRKEREMEGFGARRIISGGFGQPGHGDSSDWPGPREEAEKNLGLSPSLNLPGPGKNVKRTNDMHTQLSVRQRDSRKSSSNDMASGEVSDESSGGGAQPTMILSQNGKIRGGLRPAGQGVVEMDLMELKLPDLTVGTSAGLVEEVKNSFASVCKSRGDVSVLMRVAVGIERTSDFADPVHKYSWSTHLGCIQKLLGLLPVERKGCDYHDVTTDEIVRFWAVRLIAYAKILGLPAASKVKATTFPSTR